MSSTDLPPVPGSQTPEQATQDALTWRQGLKRLLMMEAVDSFTQSFAWEQDQVAQENRLTNELLNGYENSAIATQARPSGDMRNMVAGNMTVNHNNYPPQQQQAAAKGKLSPLWAAALGAGLLGAGAGVGAGGVALYQWLFGQETPAAVDTDSDTFSDVIFPE